MNERERISRLQAACLMITALATTGTVLLGHHTLWASGRDAWVAYTAGMAASLVMAGMVAWVGVKFPGRTLAEAAQDALGRLAGGLVGLAYALYFLLAAALTLRMGLLGVSLGMPRTPFLALVLLIAVPMTYAAAAGLQAMARVIVPALLLITLLGIILSLAAYRLSDYALLLPLFEHGLRPAALGALQTLGFMGELSVLAILQGRTKGGVAFRTSALMILFTYLVTVGHITGPIAVFGPEMLGEGPGGLIIPILAELKVLSLPDVLERMDLVGTLIKLMVILLKEPLFLYAAAVEAAQALGVRRYRPVLVPSGVLLVTVTASMAYPLPRTEEFLAGVYPYIGLAMGLGLPALLMAVAAAQGMRSPPP